MAHPLPRWVSCACDRWVVPTMGKQAPLSWHTSLRQIQMTSLRSGGSSLMLQRTWTPKWNVPRVAVCCFQLTMAKWDPVYGLNPAWPGMFKTNACPQYEYGMGWSLCDWHDLPQVSVFRTCHSENKLCWSNWLRPTGFLPEGIDDCYPQHGNWTRACQVSSSVS